MALPDKFIHEDPELTEWGYRVQLVNRINRMTKRAVRQKGASVANLERLYLLLEEITGEKS